MFRGRYEHSIDAKGRLSIPAKFRETLSERYEADRLIVTNHFDGCLVAYPLEEWEALEERAKTLPMLKDAPKTFLRFFISGATDCEIDKQGRILLQPTLREHAGLEREVIMVGLTNKFEIWDKERWAQTMAPEALAGMREVLATLEL